MTERTWGYVAALVLSLGLGLFLLREPVFAPYGAMGERIEELRAEAEALRTDIRARRGAEQSLDELRTAYGDPLAERDERARRNYRFIGSIESYALAAGVEVEAIQPRPEQIGDHGIVAFPAVVSLRSDLAGLVRLLNDLRTAPELIGVDRLVVRRAERTEQPLNIQMQLAAYGYLSEDERERLAPAVTSTQNNADSDEDL